MGTDIHVFVEFADDTGQRSFSGRPEEPAWLFGKFSISRDYALFDALGNGRNSPMAPEDVGELALYPPRRVPHDLSLEAAWEYYDLVIEDHRPNSQFWPQHGCVSASQALQRVQQGSQIASVAQTIHYANSPPRIWQAVAKVFWHTPSWLNLSEVYQSLEHHRLRLTSLKWDFQAMLKCLAKVEELIGRGQVRLVFWFDN